MCLDQKELSHLTELAPGSLQLTARFMQFVVASGAVITMCNHTKQNNQVAVVEVLLHYTNFEGHLRQVYSQVSYNWQHGRQ